MELRVHRVAPTLLLLVAACAPDGVDVLDCDVSRDPDRLVGAYADATGRDPREVRDVFARAQAWCVAPERQDLACADYLREEATRACVRCRVDIGCDVVIDETEDVDALLAHELKHVVTWQLFGDPDWEHSRDDDRFDRLWGVPET